MRVEPAASLAGHIGVPGDKSISHRAVLIGAASDGETVVEGFGRSGDTVATVAAVRSLGADVTDEEIDRLVVRGVGLRGFRESGAPIDCGNAGTLMRLLPGLLAAQDGRSFEVTGDESLRSRPMERVAEPLRRMGAGVETTEGRAPFLVRGAPLHAIQYELPVASAQVKSAVLLAGLSAAGRTTVVERAPSRDHTELMLAAAGARVRRTPASASVERVERLSLDAVRVPGDFSSAAPFIVAATLLPGSELTVYGLGLNPRRTGLLDVLDRMGARIAVFNRRREGGEPVGDVEVRSADLVATGIGAGEVPRLVDELPLFALAAGMARGESVVTGAEELRHKETDRIESVTNALRTLGIRVQASHDGLRVRGVPSRPKGGGIDSGGDHRIAMLGGVAGLVSREGVEVGGAEAAAISFPGFFELLDSVTIR
ncbi:MAG TPA: 3-phosphoshikimate 1-carboxyvinyltransferase [Gaiellaceae bacterium]|nr:3-phosphoshikimate 1-carboxyvinyltransferase [Gaiellaceae bacterium]